MNIVSTKMLHKIENRRIEFDTFDLHESLIIVMRNKISRIILNFCEKHIDTSYIHI